MSSDPANGTDPGTTSSARSPFDERSLACAVSLLAAGREGVSEVAVLTDEEILALDGTATEQIVATPYLDEYVTDQASRDLIARTAMRILMTRRDVISEIEAAEGEERPLAPENLTAVTVEPRIMGALVLRRSSRELIWFERQVTGQTHRLYYYPHDQGVVLEEEITHDGVHLFTVMPRSDVAERVCHLVDQPGFASEDGEARTLPVAELETDEELGPKIADTRAFTTGTMLSRTEDVAKRISFHMTGDAVLAGQLSEDGEEITLMPVCRGTIKVLVEELFELSPAEGDAE